jgi:hypothetical protein
LAFRETTPALTGKHLIFLDCISKRRTALSGAAGYPDYGNLVIVVESHRWTTVLLSKALRQGWQLRRRTRADAFRWTSKGQRNRRFLTSKKHQNRHRTKTIYKRNQRIEFRNEVLTPY